MTKKIVIRWQELNKKAALEKLLQQMQLASVVVPNLITFIGCLYACVQVLEVLLKEAGMLMSRSFNCRSCKKCNCTLVRNAKKKVSGLMSEFFPDNRWFSKMCNHSSKKSI
jgi:hypothetical protein